jgi:hypothetical protein
MMKKKLKTQLAECAESLEYLHRWDMKKRCAPTADQILTGMVDSYDGLSVDDQNIIGRDIVTEIDPSDVLLKFKVERVVNFFKSSFVPELQYFYMVKFLKEVPIAKKYDFVVEYMNVFK